MSHNVYTTTQLACIVFTMQLQSIGNLARLSQVCYNLKISVWGKQQLMPYCVAYGDTHDAPGEVSFYCLPLKKPALLKEVSGVFIIE